MNVIKINNNISIVLELQQRMQSLPQGTYKFPGFIPFCTCLQFSGLVFLLQICVNPAACNQEHTYWILSADINGEYFKIIMFSIGMLAKSIMIHQVTSYGAKKTGWMLEQDTKT